MTAPHDPRQNQLLAALPPPDWLRWQPHLEPVRWQVGDVICESGDRLAHAYFPTTGIVSLLHRLEDGASAGVAVAGFEGVVGVSIFMGDASTSSRAVVQCAGLGYRLRADIVLQAFNQTCPAMQLLLRYTHALMAQVAQTAVCNRRHSLDQQLCRWLLMSLDRLHSSEVTVTQELIAQMLGVRREGVTEAAGHLQEDGLIRYRRGHITVLDAAGLQQRACECHALVKKEYERLLPWPLRQSGLPQ